VIALGGKHLGGGVEDALVALLAPELLDRHVRGDSR
jgi:hypothetical protein